MNLGASALGFELRILCATAVLIACIGCAGPAGPSGPPGSTPDGGRGTASTIAYGAMTADELQQARMAMELTSVTIPADGKPVVSMKITERHGSGVKGIPVSGAVAWRFAMLKLATGVNGSANIKR
jgi:hypothetical protein